MQNSITAPYGLETNNPQPEIKRYYNLAKTPYTSTAQVLSEVLPALRYPGQTFNVNKVEYWFEDDTADVNLVLRDIDISGKVDKVAGERLVNATEITKLSNQSGVNTGDETTASIQAKRPLKTIEGQSIEGSGNIDIQITIGDEFYYDLNGVLRPNITTYRQVELNNTMPIPIITLDFEPTFIQSVNVNGVILTQNQYIYTAPNQLDLSNYVPLLNPMTIEITYEHFINEPNTL